MTRFTPLALLAVMAVILLAACGSSKPDSSKAASKAHTKDTALALANCMRTHGVPNFPDPTGNGGSIQVQSNNGQMTVNGVSVNAPAFQKAMRECQSKLPTPAPLSQAQLTKVDKGALKMAKCMRANGVPNFPDPKVSAGPGGRGVQVQIGAGGAGGAINPNSPAFQAATAKCQHFMGVGGITSRASGGS